MPIEQFTSDVEKALGHYVYRLIDPRNGETFYVGKGQGNRVFAHVSGALRAYPNNSAALRVIRAQAK